MSFLVVDLESSSLLPGCAEILTADFVHLDENLNELDSRGFKFRPRIWDRNADYASAIHGITREEAYTFPPHDESIRLMMKWLTAFKSTHLVSHVNRMHNKSYDQAILRYCALDYGVYFQFASAFPEGMYMSTHSLAKMVNIPSKLDLASVCVYFGIEQLKHHSSHDDCRLTAEIFKRLILNTTLEEYFRFESKLEDINDTARTSKKTTSRKKLI
jgi:DNA polymerase III epsilon subunit-like protein